MATGTFRRSVMVGLASFGCVLGLGMSDMPAASAAGAYFCNGYAATIATADATINGTEGRDVIVVLNTPTGQSGIVHKVYAKGGDDLVCGATYEQNTIFGGAGNDTLTGGGVHDFIDGEAGDNKIYGLGGGDYLYGGLNDRYSDNVIYAGDGSDSVYTGGGNDRVYGSAGEDLISTQGGNDKLHGGGDNDKLYAGDGNDQLWDTAGLNTFNGGAGDDACNGWGNLGWASGCDANLVVEP